MLRNRPRFSRNSTSSPDKGAFGARPFHHTTANGTRINFILSRWPVVVRFDDSLAVLVAELEQVFFLNGRPDDRIDVWIDFWRHGFFEPPFAG
jgi:hypothetical protein